LLQPLPGFDGLAHIYQADGDPTDGPSYTKIFIPDGYTGNVTGTAFNTDGSILATSNFDGTIKLWDMSDGRELLTLTDQPQSLGGVGFSPDRRTLVAARADGMVRFLIVPAESIDELMATASSGLSRGLTHEECDIYLHTLYCTEE
jgi:WD40 repeat protein